MRIVVLSSGIPSRKYPLSGVFAFDQAKALAAEGLEVFFLSIDLRSFRKKRKWGYSSGLRDGVKWYNISVPVGPIDFIHRIISKRIVISLYKRAFKNERKPDLIHAHFAGKYAYFLSREYNIPYIITEHSSAVNADTLPEKLIDSITVQYQHAAKVVAVSNALANRIKCHSGVECEVIPNIIDTNVFSTVERKAHRGFRLVTTSNLIPLKRTINVLKALPVLIDIDEDVRLDVIGEGPSKNELISYVKDNCLGEYVVFHGLLKRELIAEMYGQSDCFILPSLTETFGVAYVEAMASGLPVIATRCGGPEDFVNETNGILIDVDDLRQLKDALLYMYNHHKDFNSQLIKNNVIAQFSPEVVAKSIISTYETIIN